jgi:nucleoside triphosphate pyrophosphatase
MLILASASPRRAELLRAAGIPFEVIIANIDESLVPGEGAEVYVRRIAEAKARAVAHQANGRVVLAADTVVVVADRILGKPVDRADAERMLQTLSGRRHSVLTAVTLGGRTRLATTMVEFSVLSEKEIASYVESGEPMDKAGAYAIQGLASRFVTRIDGSYSNVVGLPVALVYEMLKSNGVTF